MDAGTWSAAGLATVEAAWIAYLLIRRRRVTRRRVTVTVALGDDRTDEPADRPDPVTPPE